MASAEEPVVLSQEERVAQQKEQLRAIEATVQSRWEADGTFHATVDSDKPKFMVTFPYPYMNGRLHLGHAFSLTKATSNAIRTGDVERSKGTDRRERRGYHRATKTSRS